MGCGTSIPAGQAAEGGACARPGEQRHVVAERAEQVPAAARRESRARRLPARLCRRHRWIATSGMLNRPGPCSAMSSGAGSGSAAGRDARRDAAHVDRAVRGGRRPCPGGRAPGRGAGSRSRRGAGRTCRMLSVVIRRRNSSTATAGAPGDVDGHLLEREQRALAAAVADRVGDLGAAVGAGRRDLVDRVVADQVADVGDDPRRARLDELVVVELVDVVLDDRRPVRPARANSAGAGRRSARRGSGRRPGGARTADRRRGS